MPAVGAATGALLNGLGNTTENLSATLLPALGPAVTGLTAPVDGLSQDLANLRHVDTVFLDGYRLSGDALRRASGLNGMPK